LTNRFTCPEELLGAISVAGLKADVYRRVTAGKLAEAGSFGVWGAPNLTL
jgi:hypothetical protein